MSVQEMLLCGGGVLAVVLTLVEITPIKINPWSALAKWLGRAINADVIKGLEAVKASQNEARTRLENHIALDNRREADRCRARILHFNNELLRDIPHTREEFVEILKEIDDYERYCRSHPDYANGRAVHAIANIGKVYDVRMEKHDFLQ